MVEAYFKNAAGDFYVEAGCCLSCGVPLHVAPLNFDADEEQCFIIKQPDSPDELEQVLEAINSQEAGCIRYRGETREILRRLVESGEGESCDDRTLTREFEEKFRNIVQVAFTSSSAASFLTTLIAEPKTRLGYDQKPRYRFKPIKKAGAAATIELAWYEDKFHVVTVSEGQSGIWTLRLKLSDSALRGLSRLIHEWLKALPGATGIRWTTEEELRTGGGQPSPY